MAWSDAARAAAAETRRRHAKSRPLKTKRGGEMPRDAIDPVAERRDRMAQILRTKRRSKINVGKYNWDDNGQRGIGPTGKTRTSRMMKAIRSR